MKEIKDLKDLKDVKGRKMPVSPVRGGTPILIWALLGFMLVVLYSLSRLVQPGSEHEIRYDTFWEEIERGNVAKIEKWGERVRGEYINEVEVTARDAARKVSFKRFRTRIASADDPEIWSLLRVHGVEVTNHPETSLWLTYLGPIIPIVILLGVFWFVIYRQVQAGGNRALSFGKSPAKLFSSDRPKTTFKDVAGADEPKEELSEIIAFLRDPRKFTKLGGKIPKGVLLYGPPGCGKTLLARAVAGEAGVPFFSISGSDFVEMFVGVGASRVRDLFAQGRKAAAGSDRGCIIFIDEIDAVGRQRFAGIGGGHDEREQTLNQLLSEMDGFDTKEGVILIAATNRADVLDAALLRPGRFDRQVEVYCPDIQGREGILRVHARGVVMAKNVSLRILARGTPGFSGADLANMVNEGALLAARRNHRSVTMKDLEEARERILAGPERKSRVINEREKLMVAYHEAGHALLAHIIPETDPLHKVSVIPRGGHALGYTLQLPLEDRYLTTKKELLGRMTVYLGGRIVEAMVFGEMTTGAQSDIEMVSHVARKMVCEFGMSEKLGPLTFRESPEMVFLGRDITKEKNYSEKIAYDIDSEVRAIVDECYKRAEGLLKANRARLDRLAAELQEREVMDARDVERALNGTPGQQQGKGAEEGQQADRQEGNT